MKKLLALGLFVISSISQASSFVELNLQNQSIRAQLIVRAKLMPKESSQDGFVTYTVVPIKIIDVIAGDPESLTKFSGMPALYFLQGLKDLPQMNDNQEVILMLYTDKLDNPIVGFNQGFYSIKDGILENSNIGNYEKWRESVLRARGVKP